MTLHIIVPVKQVPETEELRYDPATRTLVREGVTNVLNTFDKRSLTEAIRLRSVYGGSITAITMGPPQAREVLVECLGRGVDRCIHLTDRLFGGSDTLATARTLASALRRLHFDLLLLGKYSTDSETGQVGPELAELLDLPHVTGATAIEVADEGLLRVMRETDTGFERLEVPLPALLTAAERLIKPAKTKPEVLEEGRRRLTQDPTLIEIWSGYDLGMEPEEAGLSGSATWVAELRPVELSRSHVMLAADDAESLAGKLLHELQGRGLMGGATQQRRQAPQLPPPVPEPDPSRAVWAVAEWLPSDGGVPRLRSVSGELMGEAARIASEVGGEAVGVLMGSGVEGLAGELARGGASTVLLADDPALGTYTAEQYAWVLARAIERYRPWAVLLPATSFGRDFAPRVAARLGLGLTGDCIGLELDAEGRLRQLKPGFGGQIVAPILTSTLPVMTTIRPGMLPTYAPRPERSARVVKLDLSGMPPSRARVAEIISEGEAGLALDTAKLVVCVGMGVGGPAALPEVERLAGALGRWMGLSPEEVAVGGTRKVVDEGWLPRQQQVGITGHAIAADLYVALGVQGTFNHTVGIMGAGTVVAVNSDPNAPIFEAVDVGIVAGWQEVAEALLREVGEDISA